MKNEWKAQQTGHWTKHWKQTSTRGNTLTRWSEPCDPSACCSAAACVDD